MPTEAETAKWANALQTVIGGETEPEGEGWMTPTEIATMLKKDRARMSGLLEKMVTAGKAERFYARRRRQDGRHYQLTLYRLVENNS